MNKLSFGAVLLISAVSSLIIFGATPVLADEFKVGVLLDSSLGDPQESTFMQGFQLAVDQSPDISHPPNAEGGDHLGGIDVSIIVVDGTSSQSALISGASDLVERESVDIVVAYVSSEFAATVFRPIIDSETMLIVMSEIDFDEFSQIPYFFAAAEQGRSNVLLDAQEPTFSDVFIATHNEPPSVSATRGYLAGRLVDISVGATDRDASDKQAIYESLLAATTPLIEQTANVNPPEQPTQTTAVKPNNKENITDKNALIASVIVILIAIVGYGFMRRRRS